LEDSGTEQYIGAEFEDIPNESSEPDTPLTANQKVGLQSGRFERYLTVLNGVPNRSSEFMQDWKQWNRVWKRWNHDWIRAWKR
jgi:hypothetical protein